MAKYGNYETAEELFHTPFATVYTARAAGTAGAAEFAIKVANPLNPQTHAEGEERGSEAGPAFIARAKVQQAAGQQGQHWATIHELGTSDGKAFYVTDLYSRTAQKLTSGKIALTPAGLHHLIAGVASGLRELKDACKQAHGNLKATNVLLSGSGEVAGARIVLADLVLKPEPESEAGGDMYSVGSLIYQLVMHRPFRHASWPVPDSPEWTRLGEAGDLWRALCSSLLNPELPHRTDLDGLERSLVALEPNRLAVAHVLWLPARVLRKLPFGRSAAAILLILLCGAAAGGAYVHRQEVQSRQRVELARSFWLDALRTPKGSDLLARCAAVNHEPVIGPSQVQLLDQPAKASFLDDLSPSAMDRDRRTNEAVDQIRVRLLEAYNQMGVKLQSIQTDYLNQKLFEGFASVELAIAQAEPDDDQLLLALRKRFRFVDQLMAHPQPEMEPATAQHLSDMDRSGDKVLMGFSKALWDAYRTAAIPATKGWQSTPLVDELAGKVAAVRGWPADYAADRLKAEEHLNLDKPTLTTIKQWLNAVPNYAWVRPGAQGPEAQTSLIQALDAADQQTRGQLMRFLTGDSPLVKTFEKASGDLRSRIDGLAQQRFVQKDLPQAFDVQVAAIRAEISEIPGKYKYQPADLAAWLDKMRGRTTRFTLPAAQDFWRKWMGDRGIDTIDAGWVRQTQAMAATLTQLDRETFRVSASLEAEPWATPVRDYANQQMAKALQLIPSGQIGLDAGDQAHIARQFATWCGHVEKLKQDYTDLHDVPITANTLQLLDGHWSSPDDQAFWKAEVESGGTFSRIMRPELDRIEAARRSLKTTGKAP